MPSKSWPHCGPAVMRQGACFIRKAGFVKAQGQRAEERAGSPVPLTSASTQGHTPAGSVVYISPALNIIVLVYI